MAAPHSAAAAATRNALAIILIARKVIGSLKPRYPVLDKNVLLRRKHLRFIKARGVDTHHICARIAANHGRTGVALAHAAMTIATVDEGKAHAKTRLSAKASTLMVCWRTGPISQGSSSCEPPRLLASCSRHRFHPRTDKRNNLRLISFF